MIRLTVLYELPPGTDEREFLEWRLGEHQARNMSMEGVVHSEFHRVLSVERGETPHFRYMTTVDWPDRSTFERSFYDPAVQARLENDLQKIENPVFLVSEVLIEQDSQGSEG